MNRRTSPVEGNEEGNLKRKTSKKDKEYKEDEIKEDENEENDGLEIEIEEIEYDDTDEEEGAIPRDICFTIGWSSRFGRAIKTNPSYFTHS